MTYSQYIQSGFALPMVLISSVVVMLVLLAGVQTVVGMTVALDNQRYTELAREAAESGIKMMETCIRSAVIPGGSDELVPNSTSCATPSAGGGSAYVAEGSASPTTTYRTRFVVSPPTETPPVFVMRATGYVEVRRNSDNGLVRTYETSLAGNVTYSLDSVSYVSSGFLQVCAIFDGHTWCWGNNEHGQLGQGYAEDVNILTPAKMHRLSGGLLGKTDKLVSVGNLYACVVTTDNSIYCVGRNNNGQLGVGNPNTDRYVPTEVVKPPSMAGKNITHIVTGTGHACVNASGDVYCWGNTSLGRLGVGTIPPSTPNYNTPQLITSNIGVAAGRPVTDLATDSSTTHTCAIAQVSGNGRAYCWGYNGRGELGDNSTTNRNVPTAVNRGGSSSLSGKDVTSVVVSGRYPQDTSNGEFPSSPASPHEARTGQSCALDTTHKMHCWGADQYGQLGRGSVPSNPWRSLLPVAVTTGNLNTKNVTGMSAARPSTCALVQSEDSGRGNIYCWGWNDRGQLGRGAPPTYPTPNGVANNAVQPAAGTVVKANPGIQGKTIASITGGANRHCLLTDDSMSYCWGVNASAGQLGDGTLINRNTPTEASMLRAFRPVYVY